MVAVDNYHVAAGDVGEEGARADDGGNLQTFGDDGRVTAGASHLGDEAADELAIEIGRFTGREVVGQHDHRRNDVRKFFAAATEQVAQQPLFNVEDVVGAFGQVARFDVLKHLGVASQGAADGVLGRVVPFADHAVQLGAQRRITQHLQVGAEDRGVLIAQFTCDRGAIALDFGAGRGHGGFQPFQLVVDRVARDEAARDAKSLVVGDQRLANGHAGRDGYSL